jgi:O-antigen ligase
MTTILELVIAVPLAFLILVRPYLGIVLIVASLPVTDILPDVPLISSVVPLIGAVTLVGFFLIRKEGPANRIFHFEDIHILGLLFIGWMLASHPAAAWSGSDRNWTLTYVQLWVLAWLAGALLDTPKKHRTLMWVYSIFTIISALSAIRKGGFEMIDPSRRLEGLASGANTAARYFVIAFVFLNYLRIISPNRLMRLLATVGLIVTFLGVFYTFSRTGILLLVAALGLLVLLQPRLKYRLQILVVFGIGLVVLWFFSNNIIGLVGSIFPSIAQGTDTVGLRYALWKTAWRMWLDHPITGVGIGMYKTQILYYGQGLIPSHYLYKGIVAHNMYISLLAETGLIGVALFVILIIKTLEKYWRAFNLKDPNIVRLVKVWFIAFVIMVLGGITKTDEADKLIWLAMGVSVFFNNQFKLQIQQTRQENHKTD